MLCYSNQSFLFTFLKTNFRRAEKKIQFIVHILVCYLVVFRRLCGTLLQHKGTMNVFCGGEKIRDFNLDLLHFFSSGTVFYLSLTSFLSHRHGNDLFSVAFVFRLPPFAQKVCPLADGGIISQGSHLDFFALLSSVHAFRASDNFSYF